MVIRVFLYSIIKVIILNSRCPYCNNDAPKIVQLNNKYKNDLNLYGINLISRDNMQDVRDFVEKYNIEYPILSKGEVIDQIIGSTDIAAIESSFLHLIDNF